MLHLLLAEHGYLLCVHAQLLEYVARDVACFVEQCRHQVHRLYGLLSILSRQVHGLLYRLLRLDGKLV